VVVAPGGAVAAADGALADVDVVGEAGDGECYGAAMAGGADWCGLGCHVLLGCWWVVGAGWGSGGGELLELGLC
jgi:hypothetical protein